MRPRTAQQQATQGTCTAEANARLRQDARRRIADAAARCERSLALAELADRNRMPGTAACHRADAALDSRIAFLNARLAA